MLKISTAEELRNEIQSLEIEQVSKVRLLKEQFITTCESLSPYHILRNAIKDMNSSPDLIDNFLGTATGLVTGYISKKIFIGSSANIFRKIIGAVLQFGVIGAVAQHPGGIKTIGQFIIHYLNRKKEMHSKKPWRLK